MAYRGLKKRRWNGLLHIIRSFFLALGLVVGLSGGAFAALAVIDSSAIGKLVQQLNQLKKQFEVLQDTQDLVQDTVTAIGEFGQITVPFIDLGRITGQLQADAACLNIDLERLYPDIDFEGIDLGSLCTRKSAYERTLLIDPEQKKTVSPRELHNLYRETRERREEMLSQAALNGLAQADRALENFTTANRGVNDLRNQAKGELDVNDRMDLVIKSTLLNAQIANQTNQLLAQQLRVQSTVAIAIGVSEDELFPVEDDDQSNGGNSQ